MKKFTLLKKLISLILKNGVFLKLILNPSIRLVGSNLPSIQFSVRTIEQTYSISGNHEKCCLFNRRSINEFLAKKFSYLNIVLVQVAVKPLTRKCINAFVLMCLRDARFKDFRTSILGMITSSLFYGSIFLTAILILLLFWIILILLKL